MFYFSSSAKRYWKDFYWQDFKLESWISSNEEAHSSASFSSLFISLPRKYNRVQNNHFCDLIVPIDFLSSAILHWLQETSLMKWVEQCWCIIHLKPWHNMLMMSWHAITSRCGEGKEILFCPRLIWKATDVLQGTYRNLPKHFVALHHDYFTENWSPTYRWKLNSSNMSTGPRPRIWSLFRKQCPPCLEWQMRAGRLWDSSLPLANHYLHSLQPYLEKTSPSWNLWQNSS